MNPEIKTTRRAAIRTGIGAVAAAALTGCVAQPTGIPPTTMPTTNPSADQAWSFANGFWQNLKLAAAITTAIPGLLPPQDVVAINAAEAFGDQALAAWGSVAGQPIGVIAQAEFFALLPGIVQLIASAKAKHAATVKTA